MDLSEKTYNVSFKSKKQGVYLYTQYIILHLCICVNVCMFINCTFIYIQL